MHVHSSIGESIGLRIDKGEEDQTTGVSGKPTKIYLRNVALCVPGHIIKIRAGFTDELPLAGYSDGLDFSSTSRLQGHIPPSTTPPGFELERIYRA